VADVLIVEDDADAAYALADILRDEGHSARIASDGHHGLLLLNERTPDLILLDVDMPVLDGPAMAKELILHNAGLDEIPVVMVSGVPELRRVAERIGTPYFLGKPYRYEALIALVARALAEGIAPHPNAGPPGAEIP
jgi:DNA-binding NtrC family response regulator